MKRIYYLLLFALFASCNSAIDEPTIKEEQAVKLQIEVEGYAQDSGTRTTGTDEDLKLISALFFNQLDNSYDREYTFDRVGTLYEFTLPQGDWTMVLIGTTDGNPVDFATPLAFGTTLLSDPMVELPAHPTIPGVRQSTREYFHAYQNVTIDENTTMLPAINMKRIVGRFDLNASQQLSDSLQKTTVTLNNMVPDVDFLGVPNTNYVEMVETQMIPSGVAPYEYCFFGLGSELIGAMPDEFNVLFEYERYSLPGVPFEFKFYQASDFTPEGLKPNTRTTIELAI